MPPEPERRGSERYVRWNALLELLAEGQRITVSRASEELGVSGATIRRDFDELAGQHLLTRTRGGAVANGMAYDLPLQYKTGRRAEEKQRIGAAAAALVTPGSVVGFNGGTTTTEVARSLFNRADLQGDPGGPSLTVVTNALNIANELSVRPHIKAVVTGGSARTRSFELTGPLAGAVLQQLCIDIAFIGVDGLDAAAGATAHHEGEAAINCVLARRAAQVVIVTDSSKLGQCAPARMCGLDEIDLVVTDRGADEAEVERLERAGLRLVLA